MLQYCIRAAVLMLLALSSNALVMLGLNYFSSDGSPLEKLHPAIFAIAIGLPFYTITSRQKLDDLRLKNMLLPIYWMMFGSISLTFWAALSPNAGGELTAPFITFVLPSLLLLMLTKGTDRTMVIIEKVVGAVMVTNSLVGLFGYFLDFNIIAQTAGNAFVIDPRPTGLFGHPLTNSQMTGTWLLYLLLSGVKDGFKARTLSETGLHAAALVAFGGRTALALVVIIGAIYTIYRAFHGVITGRSRSLISLTILAAVAAVAIPIALQIGIADVLVERVSDDGGSADTRIAALQMLSILDLEQWFSGVGPSQRNIMLLILNTPNGIESFPLAILLNYGLPAMLLVTATSFFALFRLAKPLDGIGNWLVIYFFCSSAAALTLGSKSTSLAVFALLIVALRTRALMTVPKPTAHNDKLLAARHSVMLDAA